jgi:hypothetical protein
MSYQRSFKNIDPKIHLANSYIARLKNLVTSTTPELEALKKKQEIEISGHISAWSRDKNEPNRLSTLMEHRGDNEFEDSPR